MSGAQSKAVKGMPAMTLRDYFAAQVAAGDAAAGECGWGISSQVPDYAIESRARLYYRIADMMLKVRRLP